MPAPSETTAERPPDLGRGLQHQLAADGETDAADPSRFDVGPVLEELDRRVDVFLAAPAEDVAVALAGALTAAVEEQDAVAVAGEHARVLLWAAAAGEGDDGSAVLRGDVPALEPEAVAGREGHVLVGRAEIGRGHVLAHHMCAHIAERDPADELQAEDCCAERQQGAAEVSAPEAVVEPT